MTTFPQNQTSYYKSAFYRSAITDTAGYVLLLLTMMISEQNVLVELTISCGGFQSLSMYFFCSYFALIRASNALQTHWLMENISHYRLFSSVQDVSKNDHF